MDDLECTGEEAHLGECPHPRYGAHDCTHNEDVGVECGYMPMPEVTVGKCFPLFQEPSLNGIQI